VKGEINYFVKRKNLLSEIPVFLFTTFALELSYGREDLEYGEFISEAERQLGNFLTSEENEQDQSDLQNIKDFLKRTEEESTLFKPTPWEPESVEDITGVGESYYRPEDDGVIDIEATWEEHINNQSHYQIEEIKSNCNCTNLSTLTKEQILELKENLGFDWEGVVYKDVLNFYRVSEEDAKILKGKDQVTFTIGNLHIWGEVSR